MKVIFLTRYTRKGASSRLRTYQYLDFLESNGIRCLVSPLFDDQYLEDLYTSKRHNRWLAFAGFLKRATVLCGIFRYDKVVIEKELFPFFPAWVEWLLSRMGKKYIVDYDDAVFHAYDRHPNPIVRSLLRNKIGNVMKYASVVVAGNDYIREKAVASKAGIVIVIPTVVDMEKYVEGKHSVAESFNVGWVGSPITFKYLPALKPVFEELSSHYRIKLTLIGANHTLGVKSMEEVAIPWSEEIEIFEIQKFDVGIMPLEDDFWERGKCGYKLIQYMGCAVPVIGTPVGVNDVIIRDGNNGFKATTLDDWKAHLEFMATHPEERMRMGRNGRELVSTDFSLQSFRSKWLKLLSE